MIPKIIHYCWFGGNRKSKLIKKCIDSWKKFCPDYEFIEWNESNFDVNCCTYVKEAYINKKWAFVSDYCRMQALLKYGGIYLDTDVELLKSLDNYLDNGIASFEINARGLQVNPGVIFACSPNDKICSEILDTFAEEHFVLKNGKFNLRTICDRATEVFIKYGMKKVNKTQEVDNYIIYQSDFFNPYDMEIDKVSKTSNTVSIHWFAASWFKKNQKFRIMLYKNINKFFGFNIIAKMRNIVKKIFRK